MCNFVFISSCSDGVRRVRPVRRSIQEVLLLSFKLKLAEFQPLWLHLQAHSFLEFNAETQLTSLGNIFAERKCQTSADKHSDIKIEM